MATNGQYLGKAEAYLLQRPVTAKVTVAIMRENGTTVTTTVSGRDIAAVLAQGTDTISDLNTAERNRG